MAFILPTFNLQADVFTWQATPTWAGPRLTVDCQLRAPGMSNAGISVAPIGTGPVMIMLVPALTDIRDYYTTPGNHPDYIEVPPGSGRRYAVQICDDVGKGFPNEHRYATLIKFSNIWPIPMP